MRQLLAFALFAAAVATVVGATLAIVLHQLADLFPQGPAA